MAPTESVAASAASPAGSGVEPLLVAIDHALFEELWNLSGAAAWGLTQAQCQQVLVDFGAAWNYGLTGVAIATRQQQDAFFRELCLPDLVLARACAQGNEHAWEHFVARYRQPLTRAAVAITGNETLGRDLADQLYAELYGLTTRDGTRRCPLASYRGRGSLMGWLRTTLAQRHVDHHRRTRREEPLEEVDTPAAEPTPQPTPAELSQLQVAVAGALRLLDSEERYLLAAYYLDEHTLLEIARVLGVHEATVSRKLQRGAQSIRKQVLRNLQHAGLNRRAAEETMGIDPRGLDLNVKKLLQNSQSEAFNEQTAQ
jgi:RNA polymerase sigma-70 factor, ECF subfamily